MMYQHGFDRAYQDNTSDGVAEAYYRVVDEPLEIEGRTFQFGDYVEFKNGQIKVHAPGGIYPSNDEVKTIRLFKDTISF